jgi:hypothetical protein
LPRRNREAFNAPQPINRILQQSCRIKIGKFECRAVFSSSLSGKLPAANAAAPLMPSGDPSQRGKSHYGLIVALYSSRAEDTPSGWRAPRRSLAICQPWPTPLAAPKMLPPLLRFLPERDCRRRNQPFRRPRKNPLLVVFCLMLAVSPSSAAL